MRIILFPIILIIYGRKVIFRDNTPSENIRPATEEGIEIVKQYVKNFQISRGRDSETVENYLKRFDVEYFPIKVDEHRLLLEKTGFKVVEMFWMSYMQGRFYCIK